MQDQSLRHATMAKFFRAQRQHESAKFNLSMQNGFFCHIKARDNLLDDGDR